MSDDILTDIRGFAGAGIQILLADPPWKYNSNSEAKPGRNAARHYRCMPLPEIEALPVRDILAKDALLFLWITSPLMATGAHVPVMKAWGFKPSAVAFTWVKTKRSTPWHAKIGPADLHLGQGMTTRKNTEVLMLGQRGRSLRVHKGMQEVIMAPVREHSRKPDEAYRRIVQYAGPGRRMLELFARESRFGFHALGDEAGKFDTAA